MFGKKYTIYTISVDDTYGGRIYGNMTIKDAVNDYMKSSFKMENNKYCVTKTSKDNPLYLIEVKCKKIEKSIQNYRTGYSVERYSANTNNIISKKVIKKFNNIEDLAKYGNIQIIDKKVDEAELMNILKIALMKLRKSKIYNKHIEVDDGEKELFLSGEDDNIIICHLDWRDLYDDDDKNIFEYNSLKNILKDINKSFNNKAYLEDDWDKLEGMISLYIR